MRTKLNPCLLCAVLVALTPLAHAQFTVNFQFINSAGGAVPVYTGPGVSGKGEGTFWNTVPGPSSYKAGTYAATNRMADNGVTDTGIGFKLAAVGNWSYPQSDTIALLNSYANANTAGKEFTFTNVPDGTYHLVLFGLPGNHSARGTVFTVDGLSQTIAEPPNANTSFVLSNNYVVFSNLVVSGRTLTGMYAPNAETGASEGHLNGAQLQRVSSTSIYAFAPRISPTNVVYGGTAVTLTANAVGVPPLQFQWQTDGGGSMLTNIPGAKANSLQVNAASPGTFHYAVVATDISGSFPSPAATLTVGGGSLPVFDPNPPSAMPASGTFRGGQITLATTLSGTAPISCQWQVDKGTGYTNLYGATAPTLNLASIQTGDAGRYRLHAANSLGASESAPVVISILTPPPPPGSSSFAAAVLTNNPLAYWRLNDPAGAPLVYDSTGKHHGVNANVVLGAPGLQSPTYPGFSTDNTAGTFDGASAAITTGASLCSGLKNFTLMGWFNPAGPNPDHSGLFGQNDLVELGYSDAQGVNLWIPTTGGGWVNPRTGGGFTSGQWYFAALVADGTDVTIYVDAVQRAQAAGVGEPTGISSSGFNIGGAGIFDPEENYFNGMIEDVVLFDKALTPEQIRNLYGVAVGTLAPSILTEPKDLIAYEGRTVKLTVAASGVPLYFQWQAGPSGGPYTNLADGGNISGTRTATLTLANVTPSQAGEYLVQITNSLDSLTSRVAMLTVVPMPAGQWVVNFDFDTDAGGTAGTYSGPGVLGTGAYWNSILGPSTWSQGTFTSAGSLVADASTDAGISLSLSIDGNWCHPQNNALFDDYAEALNWPRPFKFSNLPNGLFDLVLFGINGAYKDRGTIFTVNGFSKATTNATDTVFVEGDNYVLFANLAVTTGAITGTWAPNPIPMAAGVNNEGDFCGAQLQYLGPIPTSVSLNYQLADDGQLRLEWLQGKLLEAPAMTGPWTTNGAATSPFVVLPAGPQKFYRVLVQ